MFPSPGSRGTSSLWRAFREKARKAEKGGKAGKEEVRDGKREKTGNRGNRGKRWKRSQGAKLNLTLKRRKAHRPRFSLHTYIY